MFLHSQAELYWPGHIKDPLHACALLYDSDTGEWLHRDVGGLYGPLRGLIGIGSIHCEMEGGHHLQ
jgi:hypothetical protein